MNTAQILIGTDSAEIRHRIGITAPDEFLYVKIEDREMVWFDAREFQIQKKKLEAISSSISIHPLEPFLDKVSSCSFSGSPFQCAVILILQSFHVQHISVSPSLSFGWTSLLQEAGFTLDSYDFSTERLTKNSREISLLNDAQHITNGAFVLVENILKDSEIIGDVLHYNNTVLTSEYIKFEVKKYFLQYKYSCPASLIVASGIQTACPHDEGSGPIMAYVPIIVDLFPRSDVTGYFADMTRTYVKGQPSDELIALYEAVKEVQADVCSRISVGQTCHDVYQMSVQGFIERGFVTIPAQEGFIHGTGHGLGLDIHEEPFLRQDITTVLTAGMVITVEPGLYYPSLGGVRIEDVIIFHPDGSKENINTHPKEFLLP